MFNMQTLGRKQFTFFIFFIEDNTKCYNDLLRRAARTTVDAPDLNIAGRGYTKYG